MCKSYCHKDKNAGNDKTSTGSGNKVSSILPEYDNKSHILPLHFHLGCQASGVYGDNCTVRCPTNCRDNVCHIQKGTCYGCASGWMDTTCNTSMITYTFN